MKDAGKNKLIRLDENLPSETDPQSHELERQERASFLESLNTAFPLSGGEEDVEFFSASEEEEEEFSKKLNTTFPLSGGETDDDLRHAMEDEEETGSYRTEPKQIEKSSDTQRDQSLRDDRNEDGESHIET